MNNFINPDSMKIGYGILVHSDELIPRIIRKMTKSHWNHVAVSLGGYDIVEACLFGGVKLNNLRSCYNKEGFELKVFKVKDADREKHIKAALFAATKCNLGYDVAQILLIGLCIKLGKPAWARKLNAFMNKFTHSYICSEVYYDAWLMLDKILCPGKDIAEITPADLDPKRNEYLEEVLVWKA